jgi:hypothetical protein
MRRFAAAAALFAIGLSGNPAAAHASVGTDPGHSRPVVHRRSPSSRGLVIGRESLAAVRAAGSARATVTETAAGQSVTATSWLRLPGSAVPEVVVSPPGSAELATDPGVIERLRRVLDPCGAAGLFTVASEVRRMGPARVAGQVAVRYRLTLELPARPDVAPAVAEEIAELRRAGLSTMTADVWLDQVKRPVRVTLVAPWPGTPDGDRTDLRYSDWGVTPKPSYNDT